MPMKLKRYLRGGLTVAAKAYGMMATGPFRFRKNSIHPPAYVSHLHWADFLAARFNKPGMRVLEIGSRNVTGNNLRTRFQHAQYLGFDYYEGENVDIVGDAHKLASYFAKGEKFDLIFSSAVFEHLCMPWIVAEEIAKLLTIGGYVFVETHFSCNAHERPWHFFQFSDMGLRALFNDALGFELLDLGMSNPMAGYFAHDSASYLRYLPVTELYFHSEILCVKKRDTADFNWREVSIEKVVDGTVYPLPEG